MDFKKISIEDKELFCEYFSKYQPEISELTFTNLYSWRKSKMIEWVVQDDHLLVSFIRDDKRIFYQPVGKDPVAIMKKLLNEGCVFERVDKKYADELTEFEVTEQPDMHDYVYDVKDDETIEKY